MHAGHWLHRHTASCLLVESFQSSKQGVIVYPEESVRAAFSTLQDFFQFLDLAFGASEKDPSCDWKKQEQRLRNTLHPESCTNPEGCPSFHHLREVKRLLQLGVAFRVFLPILGFSGVMIVSIDRATPICYSPYYTDPRRKVPLILGEPRI